jgi:WD40 repeat protein
MESEEEFFDAEEFINPEHNEIVQEKNQKPDIFYSFVEYDQKKYSEFSHISCVKEVTLPFKSSSWIIKFNPEGTHVALAGNHATIIVYELGSKNVIGEPLYLNEHRYDITSLSWSNSKTLLSSSIDHTVKEWGLSMQSLNTFTYHCKVVSCLYVPQDNNFFIAAFEDFVIRTVYIPNKQVINSIQMYEDIHCIAISPSGNVAAVGMDKGKVIPFTVRETDFKLIDRPILNSKNKRGFLKSGKKVTGLHFVNDDELLVTTLDSNIRLFHLLDYRMIQKYKGTVLKTKSYTAETSFDKKFVICGSEKGKFFIWDRVLESKVKNKKFESVKVRKQNSPEFSVFAPGGSLEFLNKSTSEHGFNYLIFTVESNSLKIFLS